MPRTEKVNQQIRDERREHILMAAAKVFARNGYVGTRMDDIASVAGVSKGLTYHYYRSKEAVFNELIENATRGTARLYEYAVQQEGSALERLRWLVEQVLDGLADHAVTYMVVLQAFVSDAAPDCSRSLVESLATETTSIVTKLIAKGQADGDIVEGSAEHLAFLFGSCVQGLASSVTTTASTPSKEVANSLIQLFARKQ